MKGTIASFSIGASLLALLAAAPATAQTAATAVPATAADDAGIGDPEIIVEARRRDESAQDVPLVVNAVTSEKIARLNLRDFKDISSVVPGLQMNSNTNGIGTTSSVRGVNFDVNASGNNGTIEYYLNDTPITSGALFNAMYDIGQIEVLRGPQGTLRGRASPSGSITIAHHKPDLQDYGGYVLGTVNDIGGRNLNGAVNVPIIKDMLAVRVAGLVDRGTGNRVSSISAPDVDPYTHSKSGRVFVRFEPTDFINAEGVYQRVDLKTRQFDQAASFSLFASGAAASPVPIEPDDRRGIKRLPQSSQSDFDIFTWKASAGFAGQRLYYVGSFTHQQVDSYAPQDEANAFPALNFGQYTTNNTKITVHEVRLQNEELVAGLFDYAAGYFDSTLKAPTYLVTQRFTGAVAAPGVTSSATFRGNGSTEQSIFGNVSLHLGERTEFSAGARHIKIHQMASLGSVTVPGGVVPPPPVATDVTGIVNSGTVTNLAFGAVDRTFKKTIYAASARHRFDEDLMVYANFGTSFRPGNNVVRSLVNARASALEGSFLVLPSETSKSYEIGVKSQWFDRTLTLNLSAFQQDFKNYPLRSPSGVFYLQYDAATTPVPGRVTTFNFVSPVPVRVRGVEVEASWHPTRRIELTGNLAYALGKVRNGKVACLDLNGDGVPDTVAAAPSAAALFAAVGANNLSTCPVNFRSMTASPWNANLQAEYSHPVSGVADMFVRGLFTFSGSSQNDPANIYDDYGSFGRLNLYAGLRAGNGAWEVSVYGKNITGNDTVLGTSNGPAFTTVGATTINSSYIALGNPSVAGMVAPREFGLTARFAFGSR